MVYLTLDKKRFVIGLRWLEIINEDGVTKADLKKSIEGSFKEQENANFGIKIPNEDESIISLGILPKKRKPLLFPSMYSLAASVTENLKSGVVFQHFKLSDIDYSSVDNLATDNFVGKTVGVGNSLGSDMRDFLKSNFGNEEPQDGIWWGCAIQDGLVISDGEFIGDEEGLAEFISDKTAFDEKAKVFGKPSPKIQSILSDVKFNPIEISLLIESVSFKSKIDQAVGLPVRKTLFSVVALVAILGIYKGADFLMTQAPVQEAVEDVRTAIPMLPKDNPESLAKKQREAYIQEVKAYNFNPTGASLEFIDKTLYEYNIGYTYGWRMTEAMCDINGCVMRFQPDEKYDIQAFLDYHNLDYSQVKIIGAASEIVITKKIPFDLSKVNQKKEYTDNSIRKAISSLPLAKSQEHNILIKASKLASNIKGLKWGIGKLDTVSFASPHPDPTMPTGYSKGEFSFASSDYSTAEILYKSFLSLDHVKLKNLVIKTDKFGKIDYKMNFKYLAQ